MSRRAIYSVIFTILLLAVGGFYLLMITWGPNAVERGSLAFRLGIPAVIAEVPVFEPCKAPTFTYVRAEGVVSSFSKIEYGTSLSEPAVNEKYLGWLKASSCNVEQKNGTILIRKCGSPANLTAADIVIETGELSCRRVAITALGE